MIQSSRSFFTFVMMMLYTLAFRSHISFSFSVRGLLLPAKSLLSLKTTHSGISIPSTFLPKNHHSVQTCSTYGITTTTCLHQSSQQIQQTLASIDESNPKQYYEAEEIVKKSRFIGIAKHCTSWNDAQEFIQSIRGEHPKSRHVCFGFVCGTNPVTERCSDDGEPTGTAGQPILNGINGEELSDTVCIVVRYFGGIKLGAGGLIRAYGSAARLVLRQAEREILIPMSQITLTTNSSNAGTIYSMATKFNGCVQGESYNENGDLIATIICETEHFDDMIREIRDATRGDVKFDDSSND